MSQDFQRFYDAGTLKYLTNGKLKGNPVICVVEEAGNKCNYENKLFQVKNYKISEIILYRLIAILVSDSNEPLYQNSGNKTYVPMDDLLKKAPITEDK